MGRRTEKRNKRIVWAVAAVAGLAVAGGGVFVAQRTLFKDTPDAHLTRADKYVADGQLPEAIVEYRRAIQLDQQLGDARLKLGDTYAKTNDPVNAIKEYVRASDLLPANDDAQLKAATGLLLAGRFEDAKLRAEKVLARNPKNATAQILRGNALAGLKDFDGAVGEYENAVAADPSQQAAFVNLGTIQFMRGNRDEAEKAFKSAIEADPKSVQAHLALANFYWAASRQTDAEATLKQALSLDSKNVMANRALGVFYMASGRTADAEPHFKALASAVDTAEVQATLAYYYVAANRRDEARKVLSSLAQRKDGEAIATVRLAALDAVEGQRSQAENRLREFLAKTPTDLSAQLLYGELLLRGNKRDDAAKTAADAIALDDKSSRAHALAAAVAIQSDRPTAAIKELETVLSLDSRAFGAAVELSRLHMASANFDKSLTYAQQAIQIAPKSPIAQSMLVRNYLAKGDSAKAEEQIALLQKEFPTAPGLFNLQALVRLSKNDVTGAGTAYNKSLAVDPLNLEALSGVVRIDIANKRQKDAIARLDAALARGQNSVELLVGAAQGYLAAGDADKAEDTLKKAIALDPARLQAYSLLGRLYGGQRRLDDAVRQFEAVVARDSASVPAHTMLGMIREAQGKGSDAEKSYERVLAIDGRAAVAANNLAWIYVASNRSLDDALRLAQVAAEQLPDEPNVNDTLGWAYVKKDMAARAVPHLETATKHSPNDASMRYHLGTAYYKAGDWAKARTELQKALQLNPSLDGADDAKKTLAVVGNGGPAS